MPAPIYNAKDLPLFSGAGSVPNVSDALLDWFQTMTFTTIVKSVVNFQLVEVQTAVTAQAVRQPMKPQLVAMKPEGQRSWRWETLHALPGLVLAPDDIVVFNSVSYRVMEKLDWKEYGYVEYHLVQDYA